MKHLFILIILFCIPSSYASCPIDGDGSACIAEFQSFKSIQTSPPIIKTPDSISERRFIETPHAVQNINRIEKEDSTRNFGPKNSDYSYNASCQFGNCSQNGTPKNVSAEE